MKKQQIAILIMLALVLGVLLYICVVLETNGKAGEEAGNHVATVTTQKTDDINDIDDIMDEVFPDTQLGEEEHAAAEIPSDVPLVTELPFEESVTTELGKTDPSKTETEATESATVPPTTEWDDSCYTGDI